MYFQGGWKQKHTKAAGNNSGMGAVSSSDEKTGKFGNVTLAKNVAHDMVARLEASTQPNSSFGLPPENRPKKHGRAPIGSSPSTGPSTTFQGTLVLWSANR